MKTAERVFYAAFAPALAVAAVWSAFGMSDMRPAFGLILAAAILTVLVIALFERFGGSALLWLVLLYGLLIVLVILNLRGYPPDRLMAAGAGAFIRAVGWLALWLKNPESGYDRQAVNILAAASAVVLAAGAHNAGKSFWGRAVMALLLLAGAVAACVLGYDVGPVPVLFVLVCLLAVITEGCNRLYNREMARVYISFLPLLAMLALLAVLMPSKAQPIGWKLVKDAVKGLSERVEVWSDEIRYSLGEFTDSFTLDLPGGRGYSGKGRLESGSTDENKTLLYADSEYRTRSPLYLRGTVSGSYTGDGWEQVRLPGVEGIDDYKLELYEVLYSLGRGGVLPAEDEIFYTSSDIGLLYESLVTKTLFYPAGLFQVEADEEEHAYNPGSVNIRFFKLGRQGLRYDIRFVMLNYSGDTLKNYLRTVKGYGEDNGAALAENTIFYGIAGTTGSNTSLFGQGLYDALKGRSELIGQYFTVLPEGLPQRVYDLAADITAGLGNDYDKVKAIESWLSANLSYTTRTAQRPKGADFVDNFLFESKEGYCTYFATAMAVLGRCAGVPTRYVEGVILDFSQKEGDYFAVKSGNSHAWAEAYIDGYGWIELEASPGFSAGKNNLWAKKAVSPVQPSQEPALPQGVGGGQAQEEEPSPEPSLEEAGPIAVIDLGKYLPWAGGAAAFALALLPASLLFGRFRRRQRWNRAGNREKVLLLMADMLSCLALTNVRLGPGETLGEFEARLPQPSLAEAAEVFTRARYGVGETGVGDVNRMIESRGSLRAQVIKTLGPRRSLKLRLGGLGRLKPMKL